MAGTDGQIDRHITFAFLELLSEPKNINLIQVVVGEHNVYNNDGAEQRFSPRYMI